ncbi:MAG: hypothetical protein KBG82_08280 [Spirochaetes bacterium]|jgi:antitoxin MazE|nr:hypothetical protein [Spirochaetota bacterium]NLJ06022.1 hypothetical protein [Exilispira sp.]MBP8991961.1 hypothetical protein [Spirochaetota bacterium]HOV46212.1 FliG C-terminal domain-containing protein [Exilispira sp.]HPB47600.1 FliG C-terminal domain-containing protein [Exilispira sp.]
MELSIIEIGNSKGIRIPKPILEQCNIKDNVTLSVENNSIVIKPIEKRGFSNTFENIPNMSDLDIQLMLRNVDITTLAISLAGANEDIKNKIFKNLSRNAYEMIVQRVKNIEENDAKNILIEMNRAKLLKVMD